VNKSACVDYAIRLPAGGNKMISTEYVKVILAYSPARQGGKSWAAVTELAPLWWPIVGGRTGGWNGQKKTQVNPLLGLVSGGEGGIRTRGGLLTHTRFPGVRLKPLIHLSV
jgi:hypothetical protein